MQKDKFGRPQNSINYGNEKFTAVEWDNTTTPGVTYVRGDYAEVCVIKKIDNNNKTITWAYGAWADRASLEYGNDRLLNKGV
jgi:hypothetical protein